MVFRWVRFQGAIVAAANSDNANGPLTVKSVRLRKWHLHTEYVAGTATSIFIAYLAHRNPITGLTAGDWGHILQNVVLAPSGVNPQDGELDWQDEGFPLPIVNPATGDSSYTLTITSSNNQPTSGFLLSELQFTFDFPYGLKVVPVFIA